MDASAANNVRGNHAPQVSILKATGLIYDSIARLVDENQPCDPVTVGDMLKVNGDLERIGGISYISGLLDSVPAPASAGYYANITAKVPDASIVAAANEIIASTYDGSYNAAESKIWLKERSLMLDREDAVRTFMHCVISLSLFLM